MTDHGHASTGAADEDYVGRHYEAAPPAAYPGAARRGSEPAPPPATWLPEPTPPREGARTADSVAVDVSSGSVPTSPWRRVLSVVAVVGVMVVALGSCAVYALLSSDSEPQRARDLTPADLVVGTPLPWIDAYGDEVGEITLISLDADLQCDRERAIAPVHDRFIGLHLEVRNSDSSQELRVNPATFDWQQRPSDEISTDGGYLCLGEGIFSASIPEGDTQSGVVVLDVPNEALTVRWDHTYSGGGFVVEVPAAP